MKIGINIFSKYCYESSILGIYGGVPLSVNLSVRRVSWEEMRSHFTSSTSVTLLYTTMILTPHLLP